MLLNILLRNHLQVTNVSNAKDLNTISETALKKKKKNKKSKKDKVNLVTVDSDLDSDIFFDSFSSNSSDSDTNSFNSFNSKSNITVNITKIKKKWSKSLALKNYPLKKYLKYH